MCQTKMLMGGQKPCKPVNQPTLFSVIHVVCESECSRWWEAICTLGRRSDLNTIKYEPGRLGG